jgi:hypothetical protein
MSATVLAFPARPSSSLAVLAAIAVDRWAGVNQPMLRVANEMLEQDDAELRSKVHTIVEQGAIALLAETDRALAETAADLDLMLEIVDLARVKLRAAAAVNVGVFNPPTSA